MNYMLTAMIGAGHVMMNEAGLIPALEELITYSKG